MTKYLISRLAQVLVTLFLFLTLVFFLVNAQPGDVSDFYAVDSDVPAETREKIREAFALDRPLWSQYTTYLGNVFTGDFGVSFGLYPRTVIDVIGERLPRRLVLFLTAAVLSFYMGFGLGKIIAWRRDGFAEYASTIGGVTLYTVFTPLFGLLVMWLFAFKAGWFPLGKFLDPLVWREASVDANHVFNNMLITAAAAAVMLLVASIALSRLGTRRRSLVLAVGGIVAVAAMVASWSISVTGYLAVDIIKHMVLPVATLTLISFGGTMLLTRNSMLETMREDYVLAARAKGLSDRQVRNRHVARNALLPIVTSFVFSLAFAIDGGVIIEQVFSWPGMGLTLVDAASNEDLPLAVGAFVFVGFFALAAHLAADILYAVLDPRVRY